MNIKHTPGPWELIDTSDGLFPSVLIGQRGIPYADNSGNYDRCGQITVNGCAPGGPMATHIANARLIAASPELAEALQECVAAYVDVDHAATYRPDDARACVRANERIRAAQVKARAVLKKAGV